jgi:hypothetical protein
MQTHMSVQGWNILKRSMAQIAFNRFRALLRLLLWLLLLLLLLLLSRRTHAVSATPSLRWPVAASIRLVAPSAYARTL